MSNRPKIEGKWGLSKDGEDYYGRYESKEAALADASEEDRFVGQYRQPRMPWECGRPDADEIIELVLCDEDYSGDYAVDALEFSKKQGEELTEAVSRVLRDWCLKHNILPDFGLIDLDTVDQIEPATAAAP